MRGIVGFAIALAACGGRKSEAPAGGATGSARTVVTAAGDAGGAVDAAAAIDGGALGGPVALVVDAAAAPRGPGAVRLVNLPLGKRTVDGVVIPTVTLPDPAAQAALDAAVAKAIDGRRACKLTLATATVVALRCAYPMTETGGALTDWDTYHFAIAGAAVTPFRVEDVFAPGQDVPHVLGASVGRTEGAFGRLVLGTDGVIEFQPTEDVAVTYPWSGVIAHLRGDGPLAPAMAAIGVGLPPPGAAPPPPAPTTVAYAPRTLAEVFAGWWRLAPDARAAVRLVAPAGEDFADRLVFPSGAVADEVVAALGVESKQVVSAKLPADAAPLAPGRLTAVGEVRWAIGKAGRPTAWLPRGALVARVDGVAHGTPSKTGGGWALIGGPGGIAGWVAGRGVAEAPCLPTAPLGDPSAPPRAIGLGEWVFGDAPTAVAWLLGGDPASGAATLALHAVDGCAVGAALRTVRVRGVVRDLWFARAEAADRGPSLLIVVTAPALGEAARTVTVFADGPDPVFTRDVTGGEITGPDLRGPKHARGYAPVVVAERTFLRWDGATLIEVGPPG